MLYPIRTELIQIGENNGQKQYRRVVDATQEEKEKIENGELKPVTFTRFGVGTVFDIAQTDCPPEDYPKIYDMGYSSDQHAALYQAIKNFAQSKGIPVTETDMKSISLRGAFYPEENAIRISDKLNDTERLSTLTHELGHALMSEYDKEEKIPTAVKELEADAISIMLQKQLGIDLTDTRKSHFSEEYQACSAKKDFNLDEALKIVNAAYFNLRKELEPELKAIPVSSRESQIEKSGDDDLHSMEADTAFSSKTEQSHDFDEDVFPTHIVGCFQKRDTINGHERVVDAVMLEYPDGSQKLTTGLLSIQPTEELMSKWKSVEQINFTAMKENLNKAVENPAFDIPENRQLIHLLDEQVKGISTEVTPDVKHENNRSQFNKQNYKEQDAAVLNYIKNDVSLLSVATDMGFTPVKTGGYYSLKEHDSVRIYPDTNSFYRFSTGIGGSTIDFMMHLGGFTEKEAIQKLKDRYVGNRFESIQPIEKHEQKPKPAPVKKEFILPDKVKGKYSRSFAYLVKTRCLDSEIVQECFKNGLIYEDSKHNAVFVGKDKDGIAAFATRHSSLTGSSFKRDVAGSRQDIGWMVDNKADKLYVCEAPIDAISIMSLRKRQGVPINTASYLATCGTGKGAALYTRLKENPHIKEVVLANDNDAAGHKANNKIVEKLGKEYPDIRVKLLNPGKGKGKDVNDCLRNVVSLPKHHDREIEVER